MRELLEPRPHALGVVQPVLGRLQRHLRAAVLDGDLERFADSVRGQQIMRLLVCLLVAGSLGLQPAAAQAPTAQAPTERSLTELIQRLIELDSIDLAPKVKFRPGLLPA